MAIKKKSAKVSPQRTIRARSSSSKKTSEIGFSNQSTLSVAASPVATAPRRIKRGYIIVLIVAVVVVLLFALRGYLIAALVNGQPISRLAVIKELEKQGGKQILQSLVNSELILQEAKKRGVTLTQDDIDKDLAKIEATYKQQGQTLDQVLETFGVTKEEVIEQRRPWILLDKMIGQVQVTDKEVADFIAANNESYGGTLKAEEVKQSLSDEKLKQKEQEFIENLQKNAKVDYFVQY